VDDLIFEAKVIYYNLIANAKCCIKAVKNNALAFFTLLVLELMAVHEV
jgi:hypothetical protein